MPVNGRSQSIVSAARRVVVPELRITLNALVDMLNRPPSPSGRPK